MRISIIIFLSFFYISSLLGQVFINEISYTDINVTERGVELAGPSGVDVNGWSFEFRDNVNGVYYTETISGADTIDNENASGRGGIWIPIAGLQDQNDNTIILYDDNNNPRDTVSYGTNPFVDYIGSNIGIVQLPGTTPQNLENDGNDILNWWVLQPATKGFLNANSQLPINLIAFEGFVENNAVRLEWSTATEKNNSRFEIERSVDGVSFEIIGNVEGNGTTFEEQFYVFEDREVANGRNYYRLKQVDYNGEFDYTDVITVDYATEVFVAIAPNPITRDVKLNILLTNYETIDLMILDMTGQIIKSYSNIDGNGISILDLNSGMYIYRIEQEQRLLKTGKLIVLE